MVKNPPAMQVTQVRSLGREDPLEEEMTTHSSILAWRIPWTEEPGRLRTTHGMLQARILEWVVISSSRVSSQPRDQTHVSCIGRRIL